MTEISWATLLETSDRIQAEIIKEALEAQDILAEIFQEGAMHYAYPGGKIEVCVPKDRIDEAKAWLADYQNGELVDLPDKAEDENQEND